MSARGAVAAARWRVRAQSEQFAQRLPVPRLADGVGTAIRLISV
jgi:hypothetical protein